MSSFPAAIPSVTRSLWNEFSKRFVQSLMEMIRIGSRVPGSLPERITPKLCEILKKYHPIYMNLHFNHPDELTEEVKAACGMLADAGVPLGAQTVLLRGVNDDPEIMKQLVHELLLARVKPYYLYQADLTKGTNHFRTTVETGLNIVKALQGHTSGMACPTSSSTRLAAEGKIPLLPADYLVHMDEDGALLRNYGNTVSTILQPKTGRGVNSLWSAFILHGTRHRTAVIGEIELIEVIEYVIRISGYDGD